MSSPLAQDPSASPRDGLVFAGIFLPLLYVTSNSYVGGDASSYTAIAQAAPGFPTELLPHHHAQRFFVPWLLGTAGALVGVDPLLVLKGASLLVLTLNVVLMFRLAADYRLPRATTFLVLALFAFNSYAFRYYLCTPPMLNDTMFVLGMLLGCRGLGRANVAMFLGGVAIAAASRQTAVLLIPGWLLWLYVGKVFEGLRRHVAAAVAVIGSVLAYHFTGEIAKGFAQPSWNIDHVIGIVGWLAKDFNLREFVLFSIRLTLTFLMTGAVFVPALWKHRSRLRVVVCERREALFLLLLGLAVVSQPVLAGPHISLRDIQRLAGIGLGPLILCLALAAPLHMPEKWLKAVVVMIFAGSFHHLFSFYGPAESLNYHFALAHGLLGLAVMALIWVKGEGECGLPAECPSELSGPVESD
jgi:hypothetical protein